MGNGLDRVDMGPMVTSRERTRYETILAGAIDEGARAASGGGRPPEFNTGWFVEPTVLVDCTPEMSVFRTESFGPCRARLPCARF